MEEMHVEGLSGLMWRLQKKAEETVELRVKPGEENRENRLFAWAWKIILFLKELRA